MALLLVVAVWGTTFPLIKSTLSSINAIEFVSWRFTLSALLFLPWVRLSWFKHIQSMVLPALILGVLNYLGFYLQTDSLNYVSSAQCAFLTAIYVILVPFISPMFGLGEYKLAHVIPALVAFLGVACLTGVHLVDLSWGYIALFLSAICFALAIVYLHWITLKLKATTALTFFQIASIALVAFAGQRFHFPMHAIPFHGVAVILWCSVAATCLAIWAQTHYQCQTTPHQAVIIYSFEPIFAAFFAYMLNGEPIGLQVLIGGGFIFLALLMSILVE